MILLQVSICLSAGVLSLVQRWHILLGRRAAGDEVRHTGRHEQRTVGAFKHRADHFDGA
jgi:hypothetical protein